MHTADNGTAIIDTVGFGTLYVLNTKSQLRALPTGRSLVGCGKLSNTKVKLHDLASPSAMTWASDSNFYGAHLTRDGCTIELMDGDTIPLRWDGRTYFLDYFVRKNATDGEQSDEIWFADTVFSSPVHQPSESVYNIGTMHKDKPNTASTPLHFRVVDPAGMFHTGIEHRRYGHMAYDRLSAT